MNRLVSRSGRSALSADAANTVTDHVPLSPGSVRSEIVPSAATTGPISVGGFGPVK